MTTPQLVFTVSNAVTFVAFVCLLGITIPAALRQKGNFVLAWIPILAGALAYSRLSRVGVMLFNAPPHDPSPNVVISDAVAAGAMVGYFAARRIAIRSGQWLYGKIYREQTQDAEHILRINDQITQALARAKMSYQLGDHQKAYDEVEETLANVQGVMTDLLSESGIHKSRGLTIGS